jgi:integrase
MGNIFFIKDPGAGVSVKNSLNLRFYLKSTKKYKVKGLEISLTKKDWDQEEQRIKKSNLFSKKYNQRLQFIQNQLDEIELQRNVTSEDIDRVVEAAKKGVELNQVINKNKNLKAVIRYKYNEIKNDSSISDEYKRKHLTVISVLEDFEKFSGKEILFEDLQGDINSLHKKLLSYLRNKRKNKDTTNKLFFQFINTSINYYNSENKANLSRFSNKKQKFKIVKNEIIYLNIYELTELYKFIYLPNDKQIQVARPNPLEYKYLQWFLFRCFCGMRINEMNPSNINKESLNPYNKEFKLDIELINRDKKFIYYSNKNTKMVSVPYINTYLYDIASSLCWEFPTLDTRGKLVHYLQTEKKILKKFLEIIFEDKIRKIQTTKNNAIVYKEISRLVTSHTARKTFAYLIYEQKKDIVLVKECLGHTNLNMTMSYLGIESDISQYENIKLDLG